jgi:hypothetical protein
VKTTATRQVERFTWLRPRVRVALLHRLFLLACCVVGLAMCSSATSKPDHPPGDSNRLAVEVLCEAWITAADGCRPLTTEQRQTAIANCQDEHTEAEKWRREFIDEFINCAAAISCDQIEDVDDLCFEAALSELSAGLLGADVLHTCSVDTPACQDLVSSGSLASSGVVPDCLRRWVACEPECGQCDPFWTTDHCLTVIALTDSSRALAGDCVVLPCTQVVSCLTELGAFSY